MVCNSNTIITNSKESQYKIHWWIYMDVRFVLRATETHVSTQPYLKKTTISRENITKDQSSGIQNGCAVLPKFPTLTPPHPVYKVHLLEGVLIPTKCLGLNVSHLKEVILSLRTLEAEEAGPVQMAMNHSQNKLLRWMPKHFIGSQFPPLMKS